MNVQIFGIKGDAATRKALRFFAERRIDVHFVDLKQRAASPGELRRFTNKFGPGALLDRDSKRFADLGLGAAHLTDERIARLLADEPMLIRMPLVRNGNQLTVGAAEGEWKAWSG